MLCGIDGFVGNFSPMQYECGNISHNTVIDPKNVMSAPYAIHGSYYEEHKKRNIKKTIRSDLS